MPPDPTPDPAPGSTGRSSGDRPPMALPPGVQESDIPPPGPWTPGEPSLTRKVTGFSLLVLGVAGTVLPILQGILFLALGLFVLRDQYGWARRGLNWLHRRWPRQVERVDEMETALIAWLRRTGQRLRGIFRRS